MKTLTHEDFGNTVKKTNETLFGMFPILRDEYNNKYVFLSYEEEYYLDDEIVESLNAITETEYDYIRDGKSIGTMYDIGYNI